MDAREDAAVALFSDLPRLETERLILRKMQVGDDEDLFAYGSDPEVFRFTSWNPYQSIDEARVFLRLTLDRYARGRPAHWGIEHRDESKLIGTAGFIWWETHEFAAEIGFALARPYWGQGIMTEAVREIMRFGWDTMGLNRIQAHCEVENAASRRVLEKCGMEYEGRLRERVFGKGRFVDLLLFAALRRDRPLEHESEEPS